MRIENLQNENRKYAKSIGNFHVLEYVQDASVSPMNAMNEYFMSKMNVRRRQVVIDIDKDHSAIIQAGAMQWICLLYTSHPCHNQKHLIRHSRVTLILFLI